MYIDSHCHLNLPELASQLPDVLSRMRAADVGHALVV
ncbi:MAG TPA: DNAase, partial [Castellaniella sp.]|nr:DNAase [Castellaniella sp.]